MEALFDAAPVMLGASIVLAAVSAGAFVIDRRAVRADRDAEERWAAVGDRIDDILAAPWPEAAAVTGPIEVVVTGPQEVITGEVELPKRGIACPHLTMLDRADGLVCPDCEGITR